MEDKKDLENQNGVLDIELKDGEDVSPETFAEFTGGKGDEKDE